MLARGPRKLLFLGGCCLLLAACGQSAVAGVPARAALTQKVAATLQARSMPVVSGPLTACQVLAYTHAVARKEAPSAAFVGLSGTRITQQGVPRPEGEWQVSYVTTEASQRPPQPGDGPSRPRFHQVVVTVTGLGQATVRVDELPGLPLGQAFFDAPMPPVDSHAVLERARMLRPSQPLSAEVRLILTGILGPQHFHQLVWKVHSATQVGFERPLVFSATTGAPVTR